ncbi:MAG: hypothetical protein SOZ61_04670, partial [Candidatus Copromonas sp.]|nr:hypothetical protein [Candidatus Copromonas sp.]
SVLSTRSAIVWKPDGVTEYEIFLENLFFLYRIIFTGFWPLWHLDDSDDLSTVLSESAEGWRMG